MGPEGLRVLRLSAVPSAKVTGVDRLERYETICRLVVRDYYAPGLEEDDLLQSAREGAWEALRDFREEVGISLAYFIRFCAERKVQTAVKAAKRQKHRPLSESIRVAVNEDGEEAEVTSMLPASVDSDPLAKVIAREELDEFRARIEGLSELERIALIGIANGKSYRELGEGTGRGHKAIDNARQRAVGKLKGPASPPANGDEPAPVPEALRKMLTPLEVNVLVVSRTRGTRNPTAVHRVLAYTETGGKGGSKLRSDAPSIEDVEEALVSIKRKLAELIERNRGREARKAYEQGKPVPRNRRKKDPMSEVPRIGREPESRPVAEYAENFLDRTRLEAQEQINRLQEERDRIDEALAKAMAVLAALDAEAPEEAAPGPEPTPEEPPEPEPEKKPKAKKARPKKRGRKRGTARSPEVTIRGARIAAHAAGREDGLIGPEVPDSISKGTSTNALTLALKRLAADGLLIDTGDRRRRADATKARPSRVYRAADNVPTEREVRDQIVEGFKSGMTFDAAKIARLGGWAEFVVDGVLRHFAEQGIAIEPAGEDGKYRYSKNPKGVDGPLGIVGSGGSVETTSRPNGGKGAPISGTGRNGAAGNSAEMKAFIRAIHQGGAATEPTGSGHYKVTKDGRSCFIASTPTPAGLRDDKAKVRRELGIEV